MTCHCGRSATSTRGMCDECDAVRCDAFPLECPHRASDGSSDPDVALLRRAAASMRERAAAATSGRWYATVCEHSNALESHRVVSSREWMQFADFHESMNEEADVEYVAAIDPFTLEAVAAVLDHAAVMISGDIRIQSMNSFSDGYIQSPLTRRAVILAKRYLREDEDD